MSFLNPKSTNQLEDLARKRNRGDNLSRNELYELEEACKAGALGRRLKQIIDGQA